MVGIVAMESIPFDFGNNEETTVSVAGTETDVGDCVNVVSVSRDGCCNCNWAKSVTGTASGEAEEESLKFPILTTLSTSVLALSDPCTGAPIAPEVDMVVTVAAPTAPVEFTVWPSIVDAVAVAVAFALVAAVVELSIPDASEVVTVLSRPIVSDDIDAPCEAITVASDATDGAEDTVCISNSGASSSGKLNSTLRFFVFAVFVVPKLPSSRSFDEYD